MPTPFREEEGNTAAALIASSCSVLRSRQNPRTLRNNMRENREISCTSWSNDQDRSAKAINRTADVNVQEKSDCAIVPVNRPNNEEQPCMEVGEGRAQTGKNMFNHTCLRHTVENPPAHTLVTMAPTGSTR
jgi:hypothetical protein